MLSEMARIWVGLLLSLTFFSPFIPYKIEHIFQFSDVRVCSKRNFSLRKLLRVLWGERGRIQYAFIVQKSVLSKHNLMLKEFLLVRLRKILNNAMKDGKDSAQQFVAKNRENKSTVYNLLSVFHAL